MHINPRSVLRPEYLEPPRSDVSASATGSNKVCGIKRINTNTAPVYWLESPLKKRINLRRPVHSYRSNLSNPRGVNNPSINKCSSLFRSKSDTESDDGSPDNSSSPCLSYASRYSSDSTTHPQDSKTNLRGMVNTRDESLMNSKTYTHGQAEQLRRSRESTTFALIDAQLSMPPLSQVREMYLQNRSGCGSGPSSSAARTTKKANLSVVHTVVRFRVKDYLLDVRDHIRTLLDTLFHNLYNDYDVKSRDKLAAGLLGLSSRPCSPECPFCPEVLRRSEKPKPSHPFNNRMRFSCPHLDVKEFIHTSQSRNKSTANNTATPVPVLSDSNELSNSRDQPQVITRIKSEELVDQATLNKGNFSTVDEVDSCVHKPTDGYTFTTNSFEKTLPSYDGSVHEQRATKRVRLDSTSLRLVNEFDNTDWSVEDIDFGPCGEEVVDLHTLATDSNPDMLKFEDPFFDSTYDISDLWHQFTNDKYPNFPLAISP